MARQQPAALQQQAAGTMLGRVVRLPVASPGRRRAAADSAASSINTSVPSETLSPTLTLISLTTPDFGAGTSIVALSDSSAISGSSAVTLSPGLTRISMIGISLKSPISGTLTSITLLIRSA